MKKMIVILLVMVSGGVMGQEKDSTESKGFFGLAPEFHYGSRQGAIIGIGMMGFSKEKRLVGSRGHELHSIKGSKYINGKPSYFGINNGVYFKNDASQKLIFTTQFQESVAYGIFYGGIRVAYFTDYQKGSWDFISEIGLGWRYVFVKYQHNWVFFNSGAGLVPQNNLALQVFIPLRK